MPRRSASLILGLLLLVALAVMCTVIPAPVVAVGKGPTHDTLGTVEGTEVVAIDDLPTYPTTGQLNMTTVGVSENLRVVDMVALWASGEYQVVPRSSLFPPGQSTADTAERNRELFVDSQAAAEAAALTHLGLPTRILVGELVEGSPSAGVLEVGDRLTAIDGRPLATLDDVTGTLAGTRPGQTVQITFVRGDAGPERTAPVTLGEHPEGPQGTLGIFPEARPLDEDQIVISLANIGGPSAGLMFALAIVDKLTPGALTGGRFVAGTGAIHSSGAVMPINGVPFKMAAAKLAGATVFLVPEDNCAEARDTAPEGLQLVRVPDLDAAVAGLETLAAGGDPPTC